MKSSNNGAYQSKTVGFFSLGCAKNLTDTEIMLGSLIKEGFQVVDPLAGCEIAVVNTCTFIDDAKEESIEAILNAVKLKKEGFCRYIIVTGCLSQRYGDQLYERIPEVDRFIGINQLDDLAWICRNLPRRTKPEFDLPNKVYPIKEYPKVHVSPAHYAYLKIADGCSNNCTYCVIPQVRGSLRSRDVKDVLAEARFLEEMEVNEVNLIAQDILSFGMDKNNGDDILVLLDQFLEHTSIPWIRLLYAYPYHIEQRFLDYLAHEPRIMPYLDVPIQHVDHQILKKMGRAGDDIFLKELMHKIREAVPGISLRTTVMVGFPGETEEQFLQLVNFVKEVQFDHLGVFRYSREPGTGAANLKYQISERVKRERERKLLITQAEISRERLKKYINTQQEILIEGFVETEEGEPCISARTRYQAPEVDGSVFIPLNGEQDIAPNQIRQAMIVESGDYDLFGELLPTDKD